MAEHPITFWQRISQEMSMFFRRLTQCLGNCFQPPDEDQLLRDGPSQSPSLENNFNASTIEDHHQGPIYHPSPNVSRHLNQMTEDEQIKIAQRLGLIQHLPLSSFDAIEKTKECVICMVEIIFGDQVRYLPCCHFYHQRCIDDWLMRSFTCPSCMEPVDAGLLKSYENNRDLI